MGADGRGRGGCPLERVGASLGSGSRIAVLLALGAVLAPGGWAQLDLPTKTVVVRDFARLRQDLLDTLRVNVPGGEIEISEFRGAEVVLEVALTAGKHVPDLEAARTQLFEHCDRLIREASPGMVLSEASEFTIESPPAPEVPPEEEPDDILAQLREAVAELAALPEPGADEVPAEPDPAAAEEAQQAAELLREAMEAPEIAPEVADRATPVIEEIVPENPLARRIRSVFAKVRKNNGLEDEEPTPEVAPPTETIPPPGPEVVLEGKLPDVPSLATEEEISIAEVLPEEEPDAPEVAETAEAEEPPPAPGVSSEEKALLARLEQAVDTLAGPPSTSPEAPAGVLPPPSALAEKPDTSGTVAEIRSAFDRFREAAGIEEGAEPKPPPVESAPQPSPTEQAGDAPASTSPDEEESDVHPVMREGFRAYLARVTGKSQEELARERTRLFGRARAASPPAGVAPPPAEPASPAPRVASPPALAPIRRPAREPVPAPLVARTRADRTVAPRPVSAEVPREDPHLIRKLENSGAVAPQTLAQVREYKEQGAVHTHSGSAETVASIYRTIWADRDLEQKEDALQSALAKGGTRHAGGPLPHLASRLPPPAGAPRRRRPEPRKGPFDRPEIEDVLTAEVLSLFDSGKPRDIGEEPGLR